MKKIFTLGLNPKRTYKVEAKDKEEALVKLQEMFEDYITTGEAEFWESLTVVKEITYNDKDEIVNVRME